MDGCEVATVSPDAVKIDTFHTKHPVSLIANLRLHSFESLNFNRASSSRTLFLSSTKLSCRRTVIVLGPKAVLWPTNSNKESSRSLNQFTPLSRPQVLVFKVIFILPTRISPLGSPSSITSIQILVSSTAFSSYLNERH
jgi:hypothetical protein